ncbi:hypothetical protein Ccrd_004347 [Cynara cardunculus var. scolymus]|uniref:Uncharacterized protein n=1 Tax=Cynara cardunculus var. scolymus TaxID=59895 RepID=A0A103XN57_CYNCS|nr:hypothetical protein Ccrd_004347 [Cynara cardunculus var. scolymus]
MVYTLVSPTSMMMMIMIAYYVNCYLQKHSSINPHAHHNMTVKELTVNSSRTDWIVCLCEVVLGERYDNKTVPSFSLLKDATSSSSNSAETPSVIESLRSAPSISSKISLMNVSLKEMGSIGI